MGYRSDVGMVFPKKDYEQVKQDYPDLWKKSVFGDSRYKPAIFKKVFVQQTDENKDEAYYFQYDNVKWYTSLDEVSATHDLLKYMNKSAYVIVGEEPGDIEDDYHGYGWNPLDTITQIDLWCLKDAN